MQWRALFLLKRVHITKTSWYLWVLIKASINSGSTSSCCEKCCTHHSILLQRIRSECYSSSRCIRKLRRAMSKEAFCASIYVTGGLSWTHKLKEDHCYLAHRTSQRVAFLDVNIQYYGRCWAIYSISPTAWQAMGLCCHQNLAIFANNNAK